MNQQQIAQEIQNTIALACNRRNDATYVCSGVYLFAKSDNLLLEIKRIKGKWIARDYDNRDGFCSEWFTSLKDIISFLKEMDAPTRIWDDEITPTFGQAVSFDPDIYQTETPDNSSTGSAAIAPFELTVSNQICIVAKVVNQTGKFEVVSSDNIAIIPIGKTANSTVISNRDLGSLWSCVCHLTRGTSGSVKIDEIKPFADVTTVNTSAAAQLPTNAPVPVSNATVQPIATPVPVSTPDDDQAAAIVPDETPDDAATNAPVIVELPKRYIPSPVVGIAKWLNPDTVWDNDDNGYYISPNASRVFGAATNLLISDPYTSVKILMTGESGYGKTSIAKKIADRLGLSYYRMNCAAVRDPSEWFFDIEVKTVIVNGQAVPETVFTVSEFAERVALGNCVIVLDEFNRLESNLHNTLFPMLDDDGCTRLHHIDFRVGPNVIFVGTVNLGAKFAGTFLLDDALTNRFDMLLEVKPLPFATELTVLQTRTGVENSAADKIVSTAMLLRESEFTCSTRDTLKISKLVGAGLSVRDAFEFVVIMRIPDDENNAPVRKSVTDLINRYVGERDQIFAAAPSQIPSF